MYRHNQLKEELDKLRAENNWCTHEIRYLNDKLAQKDLEIRNLQLQLRVKDMSIQLLYSAKPQPMVIKVDDDAMPPEPFKAGLDTSTSKDKQVYTVSEIVNSESYKEKLRDLDIPENMIDEIFNNKK